MTAPRGSKRPPRQGADYWMERGAADALVRLFEIERTSTDDWTLVWGDAVAHPDTMAPAEVDLAVFSPRRCEGCGAVHCQLACPTCGQRFNAGDAVIHGVVFDQRMVAVPTEVAS